MNTALGLLALALVGAEAAPKPAISPTSPQVGLGQVVRIGEARKPVAAAITYQFHVIEMKGVGWRESVH